MRKLNISLLPKGAWNNDLSKTLPKKDWDKIREWCYKKANHHCEICGTQTDELDAHEVWDFNVQNKTQTLKDIIGICSKCHGVIHFKNSVRLGYGEQAKQHFIKVNNCTELEFCSHLTKAVMNYEEQNKVYRWKMIVNLKKFGFKDIEFKQKSIPFIINPYQDLDFEHLRLKEIEKHFEVEAKEYFIGAPKVLSVVVDNYQGTIIVKSLFTNRIEWYLDNEKIKTKYNKIGMFETKTSVQDLLGFKYKFKLIGDGGEILSKSFELLPQEVL